MFRHLRRLIGFVHRHVAPLHYARYVGVELGKDCRLINVSFGSEPWLIKLGNHVSATLVSFVTHDGGVWVFRHELPEIDVIAPIVVGNNVFIGSHSIILPGVTIGDNVVIGAGSIVTRDIPANCVAAGAPARPIRGLDEYRARVVAKSHPTKRLSLPEKRAYYARLFDLSQTAAADGQGRAH